MPGPLYVHFFHGYSGPTDGSQGWNSLRICILLTSPGIFYPCGIMIGGGLLIGVCGEEMEIRNWLDGNQKLMEIRNQKWIAIVFIYYELSIEWASLVAQCQFRRHRFDPGSERSPGEWNGNPLQDSCLGNPMDRGAWQSTVYGLAKKKVGHDLATKQQSVE